MVGGASATGRVVLSAAAPAGGAVVTLTSDSPSVTVPASVTIPADAVAVIFPVTTSSVTATTAVTITASFGGNPQSIRLNVSPPQAGPVLAGVTVTPTSVAGLTTATATVTLSGPAPAGGAAVFVTHDSLALDQDLLGINVIVPAGATSATFTVGTYKVSVPMVASIIATYGGVTQTAMLTVNPTTAPTLSTLSLNPASVTGGTSSTGTVTLTAPAPAGGMVVTLASNNTAAATVPASVTVAAGATSATFTVTTNAVTASTAVAISATAGVVTRSATLTVNPASAAVTVSGVTLNPTSVTGGNSSTGTVTLSGPAPSGRDGGHARQQQHGRGDGPGQRHGGRRRDQRHLHGDHEGGDRVHERRGLRDRRRRDPVGHPDGEPGAGGHRGHHEGRVHGLQEGAPGRSDQHQLERHAPGLRRRRRIS